MQSKLFFLQIYILGSGVDSRNDGVDKLPIGQTISGQGQDSPDVCFGYVWYQI